MRTTITKPDSWPRRKNGEPIFKTTNEAIFYANLISTDKRRRDEIEAYLNVARREIRTERDKVQVNLNRMMELSTKGQFFRECLEELKRINGE